MECGDCEKIWTKNCPKRTRVKETEVKPADVICDVFKKDEEMIMVNGGKIRKGEKS